MIMGIFLNREKIKKQIIHSGVIVTGFIIGIVIYKIIAMPFGVLENKDLEFPATNWIVYSLNEKSVGRWNNDDYTAVYNQKTYEEKVNKNIETIKQRLKDLGISGWIALAKEKIAVVWSNGEYNYYNKLENVEKINILYEYFAGNKRMFIIYYLQICKVVLMFTLLISIIKEFTNKTNGKYKFIYISIFGAFLFYLFWETLTRYSLTFIPLIILLFGRGIENIEKIFDAKNITLKFNDNQINKINMTKLMRNTSLAIIILTVFLGTINFEKYAVKKQEYYDKVAVQAKNQYGFDNIADREFAQTFKAEKKFNSVSIKFKKENTKEKTNYYFVICDNNGNELVRKKFDSDSVKHYAFKTFKFEYIYPKGEEQYIMKIYSDDATEDNSIGIYTYSGGKNFDIYPNGKLTIDGEEITQDITFKVQNYRKRTYISKKMYIALMILILAIEIYSLYPYIKKKGM